MLATIMSDRDLAWAWSAILGNLEIEVTPQNFETWLRGTRAIRFEADTMTVEARNAFNCDWLNHRLIVVVERAAFHTLGREVRITFIPRGMALPAVEAVPAGPPAAPPAGPVVGAFNCGFTFDGYLPAGGNRLALESCKALVEGPEPPVSPVVVYGPPGLGKTHLLHAMARRAAEKGKAVACLNAEEFVTRYMSALRRCDVEGFQASLRAVQLLALDDFQYLAGKKGSLDEIVHTIDAITHAGGHVVVASEKHPSELGLPDRLSSRLLSGITARIGPMDAAERCAFVQHMARDRRVALPAWAVERIGGLAVPSVRVLQGAVHAALALQRNNELDLARLDARLVPVALLDLPATTVAGGVLVEIVARYFGTGPDDLRGRSRAGNIGSARAVIAALLQERGHSLAEIAGTLGGRDRSTISQLADRGRRLIAEDLRLRARLAG